jgi:hypothetical protein
LSQLKEKINVIDGLRVPALMHQGIHPGQTGSCCPAPALQKAQLSTLASAWIK